MDVFRRVARDIPLRDAFFPLASFDLGDPGGQRGLALGVFLELGNGRRLGPGVREPCCPLDWRVSWVRVDSWMSELTGQTVLARGIVGHFRHELVFDDSAHTSAWV